MAAGRSQEPVGRSQEPGAQHIPVLVEETLEALEPQPGMTVIDATVGAGGLAAQIAERIGFSGTLIGIDRDPRMLEVARERLSGYPGVVLEQSLFSRLREVAARHQIKRVDRVVLDLGLNSLQLEDPGRGFSFRAAGPLDMRMSPEESRTAATLVNHADELALAELIERFGEERFARRIARAIVARRPINETQELAKVIEQTVPRGSAKARIHPATRTFQALRIVVNDELSELERVLPEAEALLGAGGRLAVISFHSLEDRIVKQFFTQGERQGEWLRIHRKPVEPGPEETARNPRARSARLRAGIRQ